MKKQLFKTFLLSTSILTFGSAITPSGAVFASELVEEDSTNSTLVKINDPTVIIEKTDEGIVVTKMESKARAAVARWSGWQYTNVAVSKGVAANAINAALYSGIGAVAGIFGGIPTWALQGLLNGASWTKHGSKPGQAVANLWDKNKNGWIGFYYQRGYDGAGRVVATRYKTL
ncbi:hypothetical protein PN658_002861 [Enterococcus faecalis]|uniref:hypothetical protein n=1 Tax=Enterococcus faecalis TaxID=1351 RepID=UPI0021E0ABD4|nr:hypothetical protein [Enterococcus faecalis]EKK5254039.1 hypothetical protein [Enterococcus faecalis]MCU9764352.1 hypothetical protein [Enterococcus faecalis]